MRIQYWDNVLPIIARRGESILLRYDPSNLSIHYALDRDGTYWLNHYADLQQPSITMGEAKAALAARDAHEKRRRQVFRMFERALKQREVVAKAAKLCKARDARSSGALRRDCKATSSTNRAIPRSLITASQSSTTQSKSGRSANGNPRKSR